MPTTTYRTPPYQPSAEMLDVLESLQDNERRHLSQIRVMAAQIERHKSEELRLAQQLDCMADELLNCNRARGYERFGWGDMAMAVAGAFALGVVVCMEVAR